MSLVLIASMMIPAGWLATASETPSTALLASPCASKLVTCMPAAFAAASMPCCMSAMTACSLSMPMTQSFLPRSELAFRVGPIFSGTGASAAAS